jgi:hypothetical protein
VPRAQRTSEELVAASDHLHYEIWMFNALAGGMACGIFGQGPLSNAVLESFTIHTRVLLDFLYANTEKAKTDDVMAEDYFTPPSTWTEARPAKSDLIGSVHRRVGKEVAHLTYARQDVTPETKPWRFSAIANEVNAAVRQFLSLVRTDLLGPRWNEFKAQREAKGQTTPRGPQGGCSAPT